MSLQSFYSLSSMNQRFNPSSNTEFSQKSLQLRNAIFACFSNLETDLRKHAIRLGTGSEDSIAGFNEPSSNSGNNLQQIITFQSFYDLIVRLTKINENQTDSIYEIYSECAQEYFEHFARLLVKRLQENSSTSNISGSGNPTPNPDVAEILIQYWNQFNQNILPFLTLTFMFVERIRQKTTDRMLIQELTSHLLMKCIFQQQPTLTDYVTSFIISNLVEKQKRIQQYYTDVILKETISFNSQSMSKQSMKKLKENFQKYLHDTRFPVIVNLINFLLSLGAYDSLVLYYKMFEIPFLEHHLPEFLMKLANNSMKSMTILEYAEFTSKYLLLQTWVYESISLPAKSIRNFSKFSSYFLFSKNIKQILYDEKSGFKQMMDQKQYESMQKLYSIILHQFKSSRQKMLMVEFRTFIEKYLSDRLKELRQRFNCRERNESIRFVQTLFDETEHWDKVITSVFKNDQKFSSMISTFYTELMKINEHVPQSMAYFMHELLRKDSTLLPRNDRPKSRQRQLINHLFFTIAFFKDVNQFYEFTKYYFAVRLLTGTSSMSLPNELNQLEEMNLVIRLNFSSPNNNSQSDSNRREFHKSFIQQNLNDFRNMATDYEQSNQFFLQNKKWNRHFLSSCHVLHAGIWKLIEHDQCWMPYRIANSFKDFQATYRGQYPRKKLLINTKYSRAHVAMRSENPKNSNGSSGLTSGKKEHILVMSLHQYALLHQFNSKKQISYEQLCQKSKFQKEHNLRISLLSLIYCGLIKCSAIGSNIEDFVFELNDVVFCKMIESKLVSYRLINYEQIDFSIVKPLDQRMDQHFSHIVNILSDGQDLLYVSSMLSVEESDLNSILSSESKASTGVELRRKLSNNVDLSSAANNSSLSKSNQASSAADCLTPSPSKNHSRLNQRRNQNSGSGKSVKRIENVELTSGTTQNTGQQHSGNLHCIDRTIKIEAAIVRVLKRAKKLANIKLILQAVEIEMNRKKNSTNNNGQVNSATPTRTETMVLQEETMTFDDVRKGLMRLIEKKYVKRSEDGGFEYRLD